MALIDLQSYHDTTALQDGESDAQVADTGNTSNNTAADDSHAEYLKRFTPNVTADDIAVTFQARIKMNSNAKSNAPILPKSFCRTVKVKALFVRLAIMAAAVTATALNLLLQMTVIFSIVLKAPTAKAIYLTLLRNSTFLIPKKIFHRFWRLVKRLSRLHIAAILPILIFPPRPSQILQQTTHKFQCLIKPSLAKIKIISVMCLPNIDAA